ncbi:MULTISPECIES: KAP family P-loop NTPase fold protein [unclassified Xanthomonas]|uniref:KAP family P-loop NTPase fold protein n=1 Tax=Xanthomonas sp. LMG 9002 TaxID=1591158 RepID=UPI001370066A|nr:P-loop NTPase fold protein [Xanthomonas sp. LMG 9002]MXV07697.1 ATPase [Xanthomonas sp. LMG 9002]
MWADNETERDFLNFSGVADTIAEIIAQAQGKPISIGVSGQWGRGKSSLIKLTRASLTGRSKKSGDRDFVFVEFNAWLYQGYDDARAALMDVVAEKLQEEAEKRGKGKSKVLEFIKRIKWFRAAKLVTGDAIALALGLAPTGVLGGLLRTAKGMADGVSQKEFEKGKEQAKAAADEAGFLLGAKPDDSPPKEIQALRDSFEEALEELGITLVVLIDDLDRCLPPTTISTLEAIRLFLFLKNTAFVIAADDGMIKHAVRKHFEGLEDDTLITNYFDKLIQVPIRVPALGTQEVRAYMMMLFVDNSELEASVKEIIHQKVGERLRQSWLGKRVDRAFIQSLEIDLPPSLLGQLDTADRLAPLMLAASDISGNPRLIKRFLNALSIRMTISKAQGVGVDEAVLAKLLLFERLGDPKAYAQLIASVSSHDSGHPTILAEWEEKAASGGAVELAAPWQGSFVQEWLTLPPALAKEDLRGALYVGREHAPLIMPEDRLSSDAADVLTGLLASPDMAGALKPRLAAISRPEIAIMMDRLLDRARQEQQWGVPEILEACLIVGEHDPAQGLRLASFLRDRPIAQIQASIVPKVDGQPWADSLFDHWLRQGVGGPAKKAIQQRTS